MSSKLALSVLCLAVVACRPDENDEDAGAPGPDGSVMLDGGDQPDGGDDDPDAQVTDGGQPMDASEPGMDAQTSSDGGGDASTGPEDGGPDASNDAGTGGSCRLFKNGVMGAGLAELPAEPRVLTGLSGGAVIVAGKSGVSRLAGGSFELIDGSENFDVVDAIVTSNGDIFAAGHRAPLACDELSDCCPDVGSTCFYTCDGVCKPKEEMESCTGLCLEGDVCGVSGLDTSACTPAIHVWRYHDDAWSVELEGMNGKVEALLGANADSVWLVYTPWFRAGVFLDDRYIRHRDVGVWSSPVKVGTGPEASSYLHGAWTTGDVVYLAVGLDPDFLVAYAGSTEGETISSSSTLWPYHYQLTNPSAPELLRFEYEGESLSAVKRRGESGWTTEDWSERDVRLPIIGGQGDALVARQGAKSFSKLVGNTWVDITAPFDVSFVTTTPLPADSSGRKETPLGWSDGTRAYALVSHEANHGVLECTFE